MPRLSDDQLLTDIEELRSRAGLLPWERAALTAERRRLKQREHDQRLARERPQCRRCGRRVPPEGVERPSPIPAFTCIKCWQEPTLARSQLHDRLGLVLERWPDNEDTTVGVANRIHKLEGEKAAEQARRDALGRNLSAASKKPWSPNARAVTVCDPDEEAERARREAFKPNLRLLRRALHLDHRFQWEPGESQFEEGWWTW